MLISSRRIQQAKSLEAVSKFENPGLRKVVDAFLKVKQADFSAEDQQAFARCEAYRQQLLNDQTLVSYEVFNSDRKAQVKDICRIAASTQKWCQFLYSLAKYTDEPRILEIGTNVGISGAYFLEACRQKANSQFVSMEGLPQLCALASRHFGTIMEPERFQVLQGLYEHTFPRLLAGDHPFNLLFIDGNHQKDATIGYFRQLKAKLLHPAILIFDDINWSKGMQEAWEMIKQDRDVNYSLDLYEQGIVIIDPQDANRNIAFALHLAY